MRMCEFPRERFTLHDGVLVAEASYVESDSKFTPWHAMTHISLRDADGNVETFNFSKTDRDGEGEVQGWRFRPVYPTPELREVLIIND